MPKTHSCTLLSQNLNSKARFQSLKTLPPESPWSSVTLGVGRVCLHRLPQPGSPAEKVQSIGAHTHDITTIPSSLFLLDGLVGRLQQRRADAEGDGAQGAVPWQLPIPRLRKQTRAVNNPVVTSAYALQVAEVLLLFQVVQMR